MPAPQSYSDARLDDISREVYFEAMTQLKTLLKESESSRGGSISEHLTALAAVADAAACGFKEDEEDFGSE